MNINTLFLIFLNLCLACTSSQPQNTNTGVLEVKGQLYDTSGNQFTRASLTTVEKIWYKDSLVIEEVRYVNIVSNDTSRVQTTPLANYRFNDLRTKTIYEYKTLTDTAKLIKSYSFYDTGRIFGGWNFRKQGKLKYRGVPEDITDTTIDNVSYRRMRLEYLGTDPTNPYFLICYFSCDAGTTLFTYDTLLSKQVGCPLVKVYGYSPIKKGIPTSAEINFLSDTLSKNELKIFDAWEKNEKKTP